MSDGGKGSKPRPFSVSDQEYAARWDAIFGRDKPSQPLPTEADLAERAVQLSQKLAQQKEAK